VTAEPASTSAPPRRHGPPARQIGLVGTGLQVRRRAGIPGVAGRLRVRDVRSPGAGARLRGPPRGRPVDGRQDVIGSPEVNVVLVCTPDAHAEISRAALVTGKHVLCEKPWRTRWMS
jgi:predicted dehydrogenase